MFRMGRSRALSTGDSAGGGDFHADVGRRDRDAAVQRSATLETLDEQVPLSRRHALELEPQPDPVEDAQIGPHWPVRVELARDHGPNAHRRHALAAGEHLHQLDAARRHASQKELGGRELLARAAVMDRAIGHKVMAAPAAQHPPERIRGARSDRISPQIRLALEQAYAHRQRPWAESRVPEAEPPAWPT